MTLKKKKKKSCACNKANILYWDCNSLWLWYCRDKGPNHILGLRLRPRA